jgi:hypothetical protein
MAPLGPRVGLSRDEFAATIADLKRDLRDDLRAIREQLADLNGRTRKGEVADAEVRGQIAALQAQLATHEQHAAARRPARPTEYPLSGKAQAALVGSAVLVITVAFKLISLVASAVGEKALDLLVKK